MTGARILPPATPGRTAWLSHGAAFGAVSAIFLLFMAASAAPSPLYVVYQQAWGFSATTLTLIFAIYVFGMLAALLVVGSLSDHIGRRPVLGGAIALEAVSLVLFILARDVTLLAVARLVQGVATGAALATLGATLVDLNPPHAPGRAGVITTVAPTGGLALGALGCGLLVQFAPAPTHLVYALLLGGMAVAAVAVFAIPEPTSGRPGALASLRPRVGIPVRIRPDVYVLLPAMLAGWAVGGLYLSLGPSIAASLFGLHNHLVGGLVVTLMCASGAVTAFVVRNRPPHTLLSPAALLLAGGIIVTLIAIQTTSVAVGALGTVLTGIGFGASGIGTFGTLAHLPDEHERGQLFAVVFVISYVGFSVPAVIAGLASTAYGMHASAVAYALAVIVLNLAAVAALRLRAPT